MIEKYKKFIWIGVLAVFLLGFFLFRASHKHASDNDLSRLAGIISIARYDELSIDKTIQKITGDRVVYEDKTYSSKPPSINFITGNVIKYVFMIKPAWLENDIAVYRASTAMVTIVPLVFIFLLFISLVTNRFRLTLKWAVLCSAYLVFGTLLYSYSRHLTNHILESLMQLLLFYALIKRFDNKTIKSILIGVSLSGLLAFDITYGAIAIPVTLVYLYWFDRKFFLEKFWHVAASAFPLTFMHFYISYIQFGTLLPPQLFPEIYLSYEGSKWVGEVTGMEKQGHSLATRFFNYTFGTYGFFLYQPLFILPFFTRKNWSNRNWYYVLSICILYISFNAIMQPNYGGSSFGPRRFLPLIPMFYYFVVSDIKLNNFKDKGGLWKISLYTLLFLNLIISILGNVNPWENWNYFDGTEKSLYFPLLFTIRKVLRWHDLSWMLDFIK